MNRSQYYSRPYPQAEQCDAQGTAETREFFAVAGSHPIGFERAWPLPSTALGAEYSSFVQSARDSGSSTVGTVSQPSSAGNW
jgi:hypothetical protein